MLKKMITLLTALAIVFSLGIAVTQAETGDIVIEAESYVKCGKSALTVTGSVPSVTHSEWTPVPTKAGNAFYVPSNAGNWTGHNVTVSESGAYEVKINAGIPTGAKSAVLVLAGEEGFGALCGASLESTGGWTTVVPQNLGTIYLEKGENYLRFMNNPSAGGGMYIDSFTLTKNTSSEILSQTQVIGTEFYSDSYSHRTTTGVNKVPINKVSGDYVAGFNSGEWMEFDVYAETEGFYNIGMNAGVADKSTVTVKYSVSTDGQTVEKAFNGAGSFTAYADYTIGMVRLDKGLNKVRLINNNASSYVQSITVTKADVTSEIEVDKFTSGDGVTLSDDGVIFEAGGCATYDVTVDSIGAYEFNADGDVSAEINGNIVENGDRFSLESGTHSIKISSTNGGVLKSASVSLYYIATKFEAESFTSSYDKSADAAFSKASTLSFNTGDWVAYNINASKAGQYELMVYGQTVNAKLNVLKGLDDDNYVLASGNTKIFSAWTHAYSPIGKFNLKEGENVIRIYDVSGGFVFDSFYLSYVGEEKITTEFKIEAEDFSSSLDKSANAAFSSNNTTISFNKEDWLVYNVYAEKEGSYKLSTYGAALADGGIINVVKGTDDDNYVIGSGSPKKSGESWSNFSYVLSDITNINLKEGKNVIKLLSVSAGYDFDYFTLSYAGETVPVTHLEGLVQNAKSTYDVSADKALSISTQGNSKYVSFGRNDYITFDFYAELSGVYELKAYHALVGKPAIAVLNGEISLAKGTLPATTGYYDFTPSKVGEIILNEGKNEIKIVSFGDQFHFEKISLDYVGNAPKATLSVEAEDYDLGGEEMGYHDNTYDVDEGDDYIWYGDDVERVLAGDGFAIDMEAEEWLCYTVDIEKAGVYNFDAYLKGDNTDKTVSVYVNDNKKSFKVGGAYADSYLPVNVGDVYLNEGTNIIKFELTAGTNIIVDKFTLYTSDLKAEQTTDGAKASVSLNGVFGEKDAMCTLAVYENNRLVKVDTVTERIGLLGDFELEVSGIEKQDGKTYTAKLFTWSNMDGCVTLAE